MHDEIDNILSRRALPEAPHDLAERIIARALRMPRKEKWSVTDLWTGFADLFVLPKPAFALSVVLLAGFILGVTGQLQVSAAADTEMPIASFGIADQGIEDGDFL